jgi:hypothetical protein
MLLIGFVPPGLALDADELPFGACKIGSYSDGPEMDSLSKLCFNHFAEYGNAPDSNGLEVLSNHDMEAVRGGLIHINDTTWDGTAPFKYSWANYVALDVDSIYPTWEVCMVKLDTTGSYFSQGKWISPQGTEGILAGISTADTVFGGIAHKNRVFFADKYVFRDFFGKDKIPYQLRLRAYVNNPDPNSDDDVARVYVKLGMDGDNVWLAPCSLDTSICWHLKLRDFGADTLLPDTAVFNFIIPDTIRVKYCDSTSTTVFSKGPNDGRWISYLELEIETTGLRQFAVDSIYITDQPGRELMEWPYSRDPGIRQEFQKYAGAPYDTEIFGWNLMDEPMYSNFLPIKHIRDLMQDSVYSGWNIYTYNWRYESGGSQIRTWLKVTGEDHNYRLTKHLYYAY